MLEGILHSLSVNSDTMLINGSTVHVVCVAAILFLML